MVEVRRPRPVLMLTAALLGAAAILLVEAVADSVTVDEFAHLPAGLFYLSTGRFNVYTLSPPLLREIAALPVLGMRPAGDFARFVHEPQHWALGYDFMNRNPVQYHELFVLGRLPMVVLTLALVLAVYAYGARHLGTAAGLVAAVLAAFCPTLLAHGHLVGTDVGCALATFLATWALAEATQRASVRGTLVAGLALGTALLTKFSALAFGPALLVLALTASRQTARWWHSIAVLAGASVVALLVVNLGYLGEGTGRPLAAYTFESQDLRTLAASTLGRLPVPLPADFIAGFDRQRAEADGLYPVFFHGTWSTTGWWYYLPAAFVLKETLPMLALILAGAWTLAARPAVRARVRMTFLIVPPPLRSPLHPPYRHRPRSSLPAARLSLLVPAGRRP